MKTNPDKNINVDSRKLALIMNEYSITDYEYTSVDQGIENASFFIKSGDKKYVLRVYARDRKTNDDINLEIEFQSFLRENNIPVPIINKNNDENELTLIKINNEVWQVILMDFVDGQSKTKNPSRSLLLDLAILQAKIHTLGVKFANIHKTQRNTLFSLEDNLAKKIDFLSIKSHDAFNFLERAKVYEYVLSPNLTYGYNHLDIDFDGNVLTHNDKVSAIIDFDDLQFSPCVVCLGYTLWDILINQDENDMMYYLSQYQKVRPLNIEEKKSLLHIILFRNYVIGITQFMLWDRKAPEPNISNLIELEKKITTLIFE